MRKVPGFTASVAEYVWRGIGGNVHAVPKGTTVGCIFVMQVKKRGIY